MRLMTYDRPPFGVFDVIQFYLFLISSRIDYLEFADLVAILFSGLLKYSRLFSKNDYIPFPLKV